MFSDDNNELNELRFVPQNLTKLDDMYRSLCECQLLHPDPQDSVSDEADNYQNFDDQPFDGGDYNGETMDTEMDTIEGQFDDANH